MLKFKTSCAVLAYLSSNLLNEVGLSLFRYFEVGLYVFAISSSKSPRPLSHLLMSSCTWNLTIFIWQMLRKYHGRDCFWSQSAEMSRIFSIKRVQYYTGPVQAYEATMSWLSETFLYYWNFLPKDAVNFTTLCSFENSVSSVDFYRFLTFSSLFSLLFYVLSRQL